MGIFSRRKAEPAQPETRAIDTIPWNTGPSWGSAVSQHDAFHLVPVFAAIRLLSDDISTLPLHTYRYNGDERQKISDPSLIRQPSPRGLLGDWLRKLVVSLATNGNAYGLVTQRDGLGFVTGIEWLDPQAVTIDESNFVRPIFYVGGVQVPTDDIVHIAWVVPPGCVKGLSPLDAARLTINTGLGAHTYGADWFKNGGVPPGTFKNNNRVVDDESAAVVKSRLVASLKAHQPLVYGSDWDYTAIAVSPENSQFIETHRLTATQIATIYGIPPTMLGGEVAGSMTYANVEQQSIQYVTYTLRPWLIRIEEALSALLPERQFVKFNADALIRTDAKTKFEVYEIQLRSGILSINEVRALEDLPPVEGGDEHAATKPDPTPVRVVPDENEPKAIEAPTQERSLPAPVQPISVRVESPPISVPITVEPSPAPQIDVHVAAPDVRVEPPQIDVHVSPTPIEVEVNNDVHPSELQVLPAQPTTRRIERDRHGNIAAVHEE